MTVGELKECLASADDTANVGIVMQSNPHYKPLERHSGMQRLDLEPEYNMFLSIEGVLIQVN